MTLRRISRDLGERVERLSFSAPVACVYNPLTYAWKLHQAYLDRYGKGPKQVLFVGMNPGPFGMVQTGVPFGDVSMVKDWLALDARIGRPSREHPKRPVLGLECPRSEVSGTRFWGWARDRFVTPERFFERFYVTNYCPLAFVEESGRNITPDKLPASERAPLFAACDEALRGIVKTLKPRFLVGIGGFAEKRIYEALGKEPDAVVCTILHPSPASPLANKSWAPTIEEQLRRAGIELEP